MIAEQAISLMDPQTQRQYDACIRALTSVWWRAGSQFLVSAAIALMLPKVVAHGYPLWFLAMYCLGFFVSVIIQLGFGLAAMKLARKKRNLIAAASQGVVQFTEREPTLPPPALVSQREQWWTDTGTRDDIQQQVRKG